jgi:hypothetical protein
MEMCAHFPGCGVDFPRVSAMAGGEPECDLWHSRGRQIKDALFEKRLSCADLAQKSGYCVKVIQNLSRGGKVRDFTYRTVCEALGVKPIPYPETEPSRKPESEVADDAHGGYTHAQFREYEGTYFGYRRSFTDRDEFFRSAFLISWDHQRHLLKFVEDASFIGKTGRSVDFSKDGEIFVSPQYNLLHMVTIQHGAVVLITLTKTGPEAMRGCVLTNAQWLRDVFQPSVSAIYLQKQTLHERDLSQREQAGYIRKGEFNYQDVKDEIERVERDFVFVTLPIGAANPCAAPGFAGGHFV